MIPIENDLIKTGDGDEKSSYRFISSVILMIADPVTPFCRCVACSIRELDSTTLIGMA